MHYSEQHDFFVSALMMDIIFDNNTVNVAVHFFTAFEQQITGISSAKYSDPSDDTLRTCAS